MRQHVWSSEAWPLSKHGYSLILVVNVVGELQQKRTLAASRGFLAAARLSCMCWLYLDRLRFLPRDATQSAVLLWQVVCLSVCP